MSKKKNLEIIDYTSIEYPHSDIVKIEEVVDSTDAIIEEEVEETINIQNNDVVTEEKKED